MATRAVIELRHMESILSWLVEEWVHAVVDTLSGVDAVSSELLKSLILESSLQSSHLKELDSEVLNVVDSTDLVLAGGALHEVEGDSLSGPSAPEHVSQALNVEHMTTVELDSSVVTKTISVANTAGVVLITTAILMQAWDNVGLSSGAGAVVTALVLVHATSGVHSLSELRNGFAVASALLHCVNIDHFFGLSVVSFLFVNFRLGNTVL